MSAWDDSREKLVQLQKLRISELEAENEKMASVIEGYRKGELGASKHPADAKRIAELEAKLLWMNWFKEGED